MQAAGFECLGRSEDLAVVGIVEVVKHLSEIRKVYNSLLEQAVARNVKFALLMDYPDFNLRLAKDLKKRGILVYYYISPQLWAWRKSRIEIIKKYVDKIFVLFPFEKDFYDSHGVPCEFVGHPLLDEIHDDLFDLNKIRVQKERYGIQPGDQVLALMPGSRKSELAHHLQLQIETLEVLRKKHPHLMGILPIAPTLDKNFVQSLIPNRVENLLLVQDEPFRMLQIADIVLVASGTATLVVGLMRKPMVIMYRMNALTAWIAKKLVNTTKYFGMINLIFDREVAKELFQQEASPENMARHLEVFLNSKTHYNEKVEELKKLPHLLGDKGAIHRLAQALNEYL